MACLYILFQVRNDRVIYHYLKNFAALSSLQTVSLHGSLHKQTDIYPEVPEAEQLVNPAGQSLQSSEPRSEAGHVTGGAEASADGGSSVLVLKVLVVVVVVVERSK